MPGPRREPIVLLSTKCSPKPAFAHSALSKLSFPVSTYTLVVDDLDDGGKLAGKGAGAEHRNAANLNHTPGARDYRCFTHCVGLCGSDLEALE